MAASVSGVGGRQFHANIAEYVALQERLSLTVSRCTGCTGYIGHIGYIGYIGYICESVSRLR